LYARDPEWLSKTSYDYPERRTVYNHYYMILKPRFECYRGMPFFDGWNPEKGGSWDAGAEWIISHLGRRPGKTWSLDIVEHAKGFVPDNLRWADKTTQTRNQSHRMLGQVSDAEFAVEAKRRGYVKNVQFRHSAAQG